VRPTSGQLPSLEEVYVTPVPEQIPHDFPSLLRPPSKSGITIAGHMLAIFILRTAPATTPYGKSSPRQAERKSGRSSTSSSSSSTHILLYFPLSFSYTVCYFYFSFCYYLQLLLCSWQQDHMEPERQLCPPHVCILFLNKRDSILYGGERKRYGVPSACNVNDVCLFLKNTIIFWRWQKSGGIIFSCFFKQRTSCNSRRSA
jgi:hypothetical protein